MPATNRRQFLHKSAQTIINQVQALSIMVDEFRDYARLPSAKLAPLNLNALIEDVMHLYAGMSKTGVMRAQLAPELPAVLGDRTQLRQVIHNLLQNSFDAIESRDQPHIDVISERLSLPDGSPAVRLVVRDNGGGFSPAMLARAFEPYVTSKSKGTGLGLAIVKKVIDEHGARIDLSNWGEAGDGPIGAQLAILFTKLAKSEENRRLIATDS